MIPISFSKLYDYVVGSNDFRGEKDKTYQAVLKVFEMHYAEQNSRQRVWQLGNENRVEPLHTAKWHDLLKALKINPLEERKFLRRFVPDGVEVNDVFGANALLGEIELIAKGDNFLNEKIHGVPARLLEVAVDDVKFLHYLDKAQHKIEVREGKYIRIDPPPKISGGVALGVDAETGDVVLISQFRHGPHTFLTEAPRGFFALGEDEDPVEAAVRELQEEAGFLPVQTPIVLKYSYTDSGVMSFRPVLCLIFVDKNQPVPNPKLDAAMGVPMWVRLLKFYEAVLEPNSWVSFGKADFDEIVYFENRDTSNWNLPTNKWQLEICDNFTICAATLAIPHLVKKFPHLKTFLKTRLLHDYT